MVVITHVVVTNHVVTMVVANVGVVLVVLVVVFSVVVFLDVVVFSSVEVFSSVMFLVLVVVVEMVVALIIKTSVSMGIISIVGLRPWYLELFRMELFVMVVGSRVISDAIVLLHVEDVAGMQVVCHVDLVGQTHVVNSGPMH